MNQVFSPKLAALEWVAHGFGTRDDAIDQARMASLKQIHSAAVLVANEAGCAGSGDALATHQANLAVSVRTADCLPILFADPDSHAVAAVHAGWRGTAAGIVTAAVGVLRDRFGADPARLIVAIGPGIGACCYEVGPEVAREFGKEGRVRLDLAAENRRRLIDAGVLESNIDTIALCTKCRADLFHSWRRDGEAAGRMVSWIEAP